jgi:8-oxo-dGTP diphosphatase
MSNIVHVAVAVIVNDSNEVCISLRHKDSHQGGLWEFPGGKVEANETVEQALNRELKEELGLDIKRSRHFITIVHDYNDKEVCLHVRKILSFHGQPVGVEGQPIKWLKVSKLSDYDFPAANLAIIKALQLPEKYLITGKFVDLNDFENKLKAALNDNIKLVQLRLKGNSLKDLNQAQVLIEQASVLCQQADATLMLNLSEDYREKVDLSQVEFSGFHADSRTLQSLSTDASPHIQKGKLFSASCHNMEELLHAVKLKSDFVVLSPVQATASHPDMQPIGWQQFSEMVEKVSIPVYALGGVSESDMEISWSHGAQGIAAISAFWH